MTEQLEQTTLSYRDGTEVWSGIKHQTTVLGNFTPDANTSEFTITLLHIIVNSNKVLFFFVITDHNVQHKILNIIMIL